MNMLQLIEKKRDGGILTPEEIAFFVSGVTDQSLPYHLPLFSFMM